MVDIFDRCIRCLGFDRKHIFVPTGSVPGKDLTFSPELAQVLNAAVEVKNTERLDFWGSMRQCESNADPLEIPLLVVSRNRSKVYGCLPLEDLLGFWVGERLAVKKINQLILGELIHAVKKGEVQEGVPSEREGVNSVGTTSETSGRNLLQR